jgi:immunity protein Imm1 of predicted polymorphic toxin system
VSEGRVVALSRYDDKPYEGPSSPTSPQALSEAIRAMHEGNLDASLWIYIGGDPEKVGYPVIPWLAVSTSRGMVAVSAEPTRDHFYDLVGDPSASGKVPIVIGGQEGDYPRRLFVSVEQAEAAAMEFFRTATVDVEGGSWEPQSSAWSS